MRVKSKCLLNSKTQVSRENKNQVSPQDCLCHPLFTLLDSQRRSVTSSVRMTKKYSSSVLMSPDATPDDCDSPPSPNEGHPHPDPPSSPESDCDSFVTSSSSKPFPASCVTRCPETRLSEPFQDISNKKQSTIKELVSIIRQGNWDELVSHLESKPNTDLNAFVNGNTVLHYCLMFGRDVSWCKKLVANGANPNLSNKDGWHPIHLAACSGHTDILSYLIQCNNTRTVV